MSNRQAHQQHTRSSVAPAAVVLVTKSRLGPGHSAPAAGDSDNDRSTASGGLRLPAPRPIPLSLFGIPFGIAGLATAWAYAAKRGLATPDIRDGLSIVGAVVWFGLLLAYLRGAGRRPWRAVAANLSDPTLGPFGALVLIVPIVLTLDGLLPHEPSLAHTIIAILIAGLVTLGSWFIGHWMSRPVSLEKLHPGYFLPTVAGGLISAAAAAACGYTRLGYVLFGIGLIFWLIIGSMILSRLFFAPTLAPALIPTMAIQLAPAPVATIAYLSFSHDHIDAFASALGGYALVMVLAQFPLLPAYRRLRFAPSFWAFTFSWAIVATAGLHWLADEHPAGWRAYSYAVLAAISLLVAAIAARSAVAIHRGDFLPPPMVGASTTVIADATPETSPS